MKANTSVLNPAFRMPTLDTIPSIPLLAKEEPSRRSRGAVRVATRFPGARIGEVGVMVAAICPARRQHPSASAGLHRAVSAFVLTNTIRSKIVTLVGPIFCVIGLDRWQIVKQNATN
jgi:hypothetical protein